jgi:hypothetical protein
MKTANLPRNTLLSTAVYCKKIGGGVKAKAS